MGGAHIGEEAKIFETARDGLSHTIPISSHKIAARPNAVVAENGELWVRQYLDWMSMAPNSKEYFFFQPLTAGGVDKCRFAIFAYFNDGQLARVGGEAFECEGSSDVLRKARRLIEQNECNKGESAGEKSPGSRFRSGNYWKVPTYLDRRLMDLDFMERYTRKDPDKSGIVEKELLITPAEALELTFLREIVERARPRLHRH